MVTNILEPQVMLSELESLPNLIENRLPIFLQSIQSTLNDFDLSPFKKIYLVGCGDSYHAALASELLFERSTGIDCEAVNGLRFLEYTSELGAERSIVIGISASGRSTRVVDSVIASKKRNLTFAMTGDPESPLAKNAHHLLDVNIPFMGKSPGIRTYFSSLLGLVLTGSVFGQIKKNKNHPGDINDNPTLTKLPDHIQNTLSSCEPAARKFAAKIKDAPAIIFLGSGPSFGTAMFSAAKVCEACGVLSFAQDLEEFAHVENLCYPNNLPVCVIAPKGKSHWRAVEISKMSSELGKRVVVIAENNDQDFNDFNGDLSTIPVNLPEEYTAFLYPIFGTYLAAYLTLELGRKLFRSDSRGNRPLVNSNIQMAAGNPG